MRNYLPFLLCGLMFCLFGWSQKKSGGWQNLFDGKSLHGWKKLAGSANYEVADGAIVGSTVAGSGNTFLATEKEYGNFILELDIKIESIKGNSGIQTRSHYNAAANDGNELFDQYSIRSERESHTAIIALFSSGVLEKR